MFHLALTFAKQEVALPFLKSNINIAVEDLWTGSILFWHKGSAIFWRRGSNCFGLGGHSRADFPGPTNNNGLPYFDGVLRMFFIDDNKDQLFGLKFTL